ncbi:hypothetical protein SAMN05518684_103328 [Salipaludibacillus aurantiacus]|uniref:Uncharacterized protein n=1 Tax=Salipaludibacillus aurantiacus TaxID=1601833 RepID=A0A1H9RTM1_9BACI|nr:hypothetical protein SAMN05518684_103328 [Salipaludibacillus aurantiacus]
MKNYFMTKQTEYFYRIKSIVMAGPLRYFLCLTSKVYPKGDDS